MAAPLMIQTWGELRALLPRQAQFWRWDYDPGAASWLVPGPWSDEPDKISWIDPDTGKPCMIERGKVGQWCGFAAVELNHPLFGVQPWDTDLVAHGGVSLAHRCETGNAWWLGFECDHAWDLTPNDMRLHKILGGVRSPNETYRDARYVINEVLMLARQL